MSAPFSPYQSPKQSKLGSIGKKVMDALRQMEISADSWQAPGESNAGQGSWVRNNSQPGSAGQWRPQQSREAMMLEVERQKCLRELKRLQEEDDQFRKKQSMQSPSEATSQGMRSHAQQHDQSARRLTQDLADLEMRKRRLMEQQAAAEQHFREQTEHHDRQLQERMDALQRSPPGPPAAEYQQSQPSPQEEGYPGMLHKSPSMRQTSAPRTPSGRTSVAYPSTPMSKVDELYSRMSNDELKQLAAMNNVPSFDKIPFATPAMKPSDPRHFDQHGPSSRYPQGGGGGGGGPRDPSFSGASRPPWAASTSAPQQPPWEKWQPRQTPREWESMDDIRAQSAPLYREQFRGQVPTQHHEHGPRRRSNSEASASHDPFGLDASGPLGDGYQGYGGSSFNNPFDDYPGPPGMGGGNDSLDQLNPDDIFGTGDDSFDDANDWPPYPPQPQQQTGPSDPRNAPWSGYGSRGRSRTTSESSIPFGVQGETFPRGPPQQDPRRQRRNSMMHPRGGPPQYPYQQQQQQQQQWERQQGRMRSNSGPPRPSYPPRHPGGPGGQFGEANHDQSWRQFRPPDQYRQQQMPPPPQRNLISRDDIEQARFQASRIRQERHREEERRQYEHPLANQPPYQQPQQQQQGRPPSPPPWHQRPDELKPTDGLSDEDLSYLADDAIVRDLVLGKLSPNERRQVMERLDRLGQASQPLGRDQTGGNSQRWRTGGSSSQAHQDGQMGANSTAFPAMSPPQPPQPPTAAGVRFQDQLTPRASPTATPFSAQTPLSRTDMPIGYPGKPPSFPDLPQAKEFRVHQQGRPMDGLENLQVLRHLTSYPSASIDPSLQQNEIVATQILDLVSQAKNLGAVALRQLQTRDLPSGQYIVEGDAVQ